MKQVRYTVEMDMFIWATDDEDANKQARELQATINADYDNNAKTLNLYCTPVASHTARTVKVTAP